MLVRKYVKVSNSSTKRVWKKQSIPFVNRWLYFRFSFLLFLLLSCWQQSHVDAVPPEVREWLASTFTRQLVTTRKRTEEKPKFRTVAHAIRAGIFVDRIYRRVSSTAMLQFPPDVVKVLKTLDDWSFDQFALAAATNGQPIKYLGYDLLNRYGIIHKFKVSPTVLEQFLVKIEEGYCRYQVFSNTKRLHLCLCMRLRLIYLFVFFFMQNPYHNNLHAADVAQTIHYMLCQTGVMHHLTDLEIYAILIAAIIHDYEHTGTTNSFHINTGSDMAMLYNDRAVLENHHASAAFRILKEDEYNIFSNLSREEYKEIRNLVIDMVISTDMSFHNQQLKNMKSLIAIASSDTHYNKTNVDLKFKALSFILHCKSNSHFFFFTVLQCHHPPPPLGNLNSVNLNFSEKWSDFYESELHYFPGKLTRLKEILK